MDDHPRHNVAAIDESAGNVTGWNAEVNNTKMVDGVASCGSFLCLFGDFYTVVRRSQRAFAVIGTSVPSAGPRITHYEYSDPTVIPIRAQTTKVNTPTAALPFRVSDDDTPATSLTLTGASSSTVLVPLANIVFGGSGGNRTVTITPAPAQTGEGAVADGHGHACPRGQRGRSAHVTFTFFTGDAEVITLTRTIAANSRTTLNLEWEDPRLANVGVSTQVTSDLPVVSERSMYWPGGADRWYEAHNSFGSTMLNTKWGLAEGAVGGDLGFETCILVNNPNPTDVDVTATYLRYSGAPIVKTYRVNATSRFNIYVNGFVKELQDEIFATVIEAPLPIAVERAMYWNALDAGWAGGTNAGATPGFRGFRRSGGSSDPPSKGPEVSRRFGREAPRRFRVPRARAL